jgi:CBS-domain-containing membrane protein
MVTRPAVHRPLATVGELRAFFADDHAHMALLVDGSELIGTVERSDLIAATSNEAAAREFATLDRRTILPDAALSEAHARLRRTGRRRLAVISEDATLLGLLCLKASGLGFCSDDDVASRTCQSRRPRRRISSPARQ